MLAKQRQAMILKEVRRYGGVRISDLVGQLGVSDMTVRRDLDVLARNGLLEKVHGGATTVAEPSTDEPGFEAKSLRELPEKESLVMEAVRLVRPGCAVGLSAGTTTWLLAHQLREIGELTVVTNSIHVSDVFHETQNPGQTVLLTGGIRTPSDALVGPMAVSALRNLHLDVVFVGAHGMDPRAGLTTPNLMEAESNRALIDAGHRLIAVADHTKWGVVGISTFAALDEVDVLVTDTGLGDQARQVAREHVGELLVTTVQSRHEERNG